METDLKDIEDAAWRDLRSAVTDPKDALRFLTLSSVDAKTRPQSRTVVLRDVLAEQRTFEFHTDICSGKWSELAQNSSASVLGYCPQRRVQLRFQGRAVLYGPDSAKAKTAWSNLPIWTKQTYAGGPPGDDLPRQMNAPQTTAGHEAFGLIKVIAQTLDWVRLERENNQRARFDYDESGNLAGGSWIQP